MIKDKSLLKREYLDRLLKLAIPIMLSNIIAQVQMLIDRIFLGHVNKLYMSALGNVSSPMWTTMSFCFSITVGASILISQAVGAKDEDHIETYAASLIKWNNVLPVLLFFFWFFKSDLVFRVMGVSDKILPMCVGYARNYAPVFLFVGMSASVTVILQTSNYTKPLVYYGLVRSISNIILDYLLIFGHYGFPRLEMEGAAIATTIAEYMGNFFVLVVVLKNKNLKTKPALSNILKAKVEPYIRSVKLGINAAFEDFTWNFGNLVLVRILNTISVMAAGVYNIVFGIEVLAVVLIGAVGNGTMTLTGEATGKKDVKQYKGVCIYAYLFSVTVALITLLASLLFPQQLIALFTTDKEIIATSGIYLVFISINLYSKSANIIIGNGIRGSGNTSWMFYTQIFGTFFVVSLACLFVFALKLGITGVFLAVMLDEFVRAIINFMKYRHITKQFHEIASTRKGLA